MSPIVQAQQLPEKSLMVAIDPNYNFPNEAKLPDHWNNSFDARQEAELRRRWAPSAKYPEKDFVLWSTKYPAEAKTWVDAERSTLRQEREASLTDYLLAADIHKKTPAKDRTSFSDPDLTQTFSTLQMIGVRYMVAPDLTAPQTHAVIAEVRRASANPVALIEDIKGQLRQVDPAVQNQFKDVNAKLDGLRAALREWSVALGQEAKPDEKTLASLARACGDQFTAVQDAVLAFAPTAAVNARDKLLVTTVVREYIETMAGVVGDQFAARAATPSFQNMFNRLTEQPHGTEVDSILKSAISAASGNYRSVWSSRRDDLIDRIRDPGERAALEKTLDLNKVDLGPSLAKWKEQLDKLSKQKYDLATMRDAILNIAYACEGYRRLVNSVVIQPDVRDGFKKLLDGLQFSISQDVKFCTDNV